jgi:hypothetical protein
MNPRLKRPEAPPHLAELAGRGSGHGGSRDAGTTPHLDLSAKADIAFSEPRIHSPRRERVRACRRPSPSATLSHDPEGRDMQSEFDEPILLHGERLPHLQLPSAPAGDGVLLVAPGGRVFPVIVAVHGAECDGCRAYLRRLAAVEGEIREWDGRVLVIVPGGVEEAARLSIDPPLTVLADADGG